MKRIVVSTSSSLNNINAPHNIYLVPFHIKVNGVDYLDQEFDSLQLSQMICKGTNIRVKSSPATEAEVHTLFEKLCDEGYQEVLICTISSAISNSYQIFDRLKAKYVGCMNIYVYDTKTLNIDEGALAFEADLMMREGKFMFEIITRLDELRRHSLFMFTLSDLGFIVKNKKLSAPAGFIANLLGVKPVMWVNDDGLVVPKDTTLKMERSLHYMVDSAMARISGHDAFVYMIDASLGRFTESFQRLLTNDYGLKNIPVVPVSTVSLANHGPTGVGLGVYYKEVPRITQYLD